jgi:tetratricopeptide (TPR) repeat protein
VPVDPDEGPLQAFAWELRQLRERCGRPTYSALAKKTGYSRATLAKAAGGREKPTEEVVLAYAVACGGDRHEWLSRYQELMRALGNAGPVRKVPAHAPDQPRPPVADGSLAVVLEDLAGAVADQWRDEARAWGLWSLWDSPSELQVRWSATDRKVTDHVTAVYGPHDSARIAAGGVVADLVDLLETLPARRLVILGVPGSGKTASAIRLVTALLAARRPGEPVPVLVPAGLWNPAERSLSELLTDYLATTYPALRAPTGNGPTLAAELTRMRLVVPVIDGLDEIAAALRPVAIRRINIELDSASPVVVTARGREYEDAVHASGGDVLTAAAVVELHPLRPEEVQNHLRRVIAPHRLGQWHPVFTCLDEQPSGALATALSTPLMVWLTRVAYGTGAAEPKELLSDELADRSAIEDHLLDHLVPTVYGSDWGTDPVPGLAEHYRKQPTVDEARRWLCWLATHLRMADTAELAWWLFPRGTPRLTGRVAIGVLAGVAAAPIAGLVYALVFGPVDGFLYGAAASVLSSVAYGLVATFSTAKAPLRTQPRLWMGIGRYAAGLRTGIRAGLASGLILGTVSALAYAVVDGHDHTRAIGLTTGLAAGLTIGLSSGLAVLLAVGLTCALDVPTSVTRATNPTAVLNADRAATVLRGCIVGLAVGITDLLLSDALAVVFVPAIPGVGTSQLLVAVSGEGLVFGAGAGVAAALATAYGRFTLSRAWLALTGRLPWPIMTFLDDAHRRGILRQEGGTYQFRHARLQDRLASEPQYADRPAEVATGMASEGGLRRDPELQPSPAEAGSPDKASPPFQLPAAVSGFTGRVPAMAELDALLEAAPGGPAAAFAAIVGTAGVGKTALAVHWGMRRRDRFPDGQLYVNLGGYTASGGGQIRPDQALARFLRALGVPPEEVPLDVEEAAALYRSILADRRVLVVLDNARAPDQVRPLLPAGPGCLVLVTSRNRLTGLAARDGARLLALDVLSADEAHALLSTLVGARRVAAEPATARELAELCGHLPLALRIVGAHLAGDPHRTFAEHTAQLRAGNRLTMLQVDGDDESAVRASFDLSYATLKPRARRLFRLIGVVPGADFAPPAAAALADATIAATHETLGHLLDAHLLDEPGPGRFAVHDLLRVYARELTEAEDSAAERSAAIRRLADLYLATTDAAAGVLYPQMQRLPLEPPAAPTAVVLSDHATALAWLEEELPNLVAMVRHTAEVGPHPVAWSLADALRGFFWIRWYADDGLAVGAASLAAAVADDDAYGLAAAHLCLAQVNRRLTRHEQAIDHFGQARMQARRAGWSQGEAAALGGSAISYNDRGRLAEAAAHYRSGLEIFQRTGSLGGQAVSLTNLGNVLLACGRVAEGIDHLTRALRIYEEIASPYVQAYVVNSLGCAYHILGRSDEALAHLERALAVHREGGSREGVADTLNNLGQVHCTAGRYEEAIRLAGASLTEAGEAGAQRVEVDAHNTLGTIHRRLGDVPRAHGEHRVALRLARDVGYRQGEAAALIGLAEALRLLGRVEQARAAGTDALAVTERTGYRLLHADALTALAATELTEGTVDRALAHAHEALAIHQEAGHRTGEAAVAELLRDVR